MSLLKNNKGFSLIQAILVAAILSFVALSLSTIVEQMALAQKKDTLVTTALNLQEGIKSQLLSDASWEKTIGHPDNNDLHCLASDTCTPTLANRPLKVIGANDQILFDGLTSTAGFTSAGTPCSNYNETNGNNDCPLRLEIRASIQCEATATSCPKKPVVITGTLHYKPSSSNNLAFNPERFNFTFTRLAASLVKTHCESLSGAYDSTTGNCTLGTIAQCPSGQYVKGFDNQGHPDCAALPPATSPPAVGTVTPDCGAGKEVSTINWDNGTYTCKTTIAATPPPPPPPAAPPTTSAPTTGTWHQGSGGTIQGAVSVAGGICGPTGTSATGKTCTLGSPPMRCAAGKFAIFYVCY